MFSHEILGTSTSTSVSSGGTGGTGDTSTYIVGGHMSGTSMLLERANGGVLEVRDVNSDTGEFDHFIAGTAQLIVSATEAVSDWSSI